MLPTPILQFPTILGNFVSISQLSLQVGDLYGCSLLVLFHYYLDIYYYDICAENSFYVYKQM